MRAIAVLMHILAVRLDRFATSFKNYLRKTAANNERLIEKCSVQRPPLGLLFFRYNGGGSTRKDTPLTKVSQISEKMLSDYIAIGLPKKPLITILPFTALLPGLWLGVAKYIAHLRHNGRRVLTSKSMCETSQTPRFHSGG